MTHYIDEQYFRYRVRRFVEQPETAPEHEPDIIDGLQQLRQSLYERYPFLRHGDLEREDG